MKNQLSKKLIDFGLDPNEWMLKKQTPKKFLITHRADKGFKFLGIADDSQTNWRAMVLISL